MVESADALSAVAVDRTTLRLLHAAGQVFAEQGFARATVREICNLADANIAAVNYHFGGKEKLYAAALSFWKDEALLKYPPTLGLPADASADQRLAAFVRSLLLRLFDPGRPTWHGKLVARELIEPTPAFDEHLQTFVRPLLDLLRNIVAALLGPELIAADPALVGRCTASVVSQCLFYIHHRSCLEKLLPEQQYDPQSIDQIAEHVTRFSLSAIRGLRQPLRSPRTPM